MLLGSFTVVIGCYFVNEAVFWFGEGETFTFDFAFTLQFVGYLLWFLTAGMVLSSLTGGRLRVLIPTAVLVAVGLYLSSHNWIDPEAPFLSYAIDLTKYHLLMLMVIPVFAVTAFLWNSRNPPNKSLNSDTGTAGAG